MPEEIQYRGVIGQITWSYHVAAAVHGYVATINKRTHGGRLRATVVTSDAFKLTQRPLYFVAPHRAGAFRWRIDTIEIDTLGTVLATLSPAEEAYEPTHATTGHGQN